MKKNKREIENNNVSFGGLKLKHLTRFEPNHALNGLLKYVKNLKTK